MASSVRLSIVTVCFNDLNNARKTLESISMQSQREHWEHVLIDGASDDGTAEWYRSSEFDFPHTLVSEPDKGIFDAMNKSLKIIEGDYILFLNAGDLFADREVISRILLRLPEIVSWGYSVASVVDGNGKRVHRDIGRIPYSRSSHLFRIGQICHQTVIMKSEFLRSINGFDLRMGNGADYHLLLRVGAHELPATWESVDVFYLAGGVSEREIYKTLWLGHRCRVEALAMRPAVIILDKAWVSFQVLQIWLRKKIKPLLGLFLKKSLL